MSPKRHSLPGVLKAAGNDRPWGPAKGKKPLEEKRAVILRTIERHLRGEKGAPKLERFDPAHRAPVIRVLDGNDPLPMFDGQPRAVIDPEADRETLWGAILEHLRAGLYDAEIEQVARKIYQATKARAQKGS